MPFIKTSQLKTISKCLRQMNEGFLDWYSEYQRKFVDNETINESMYEKQMLLESLRESMAVLSEIEQEYKKYNDYCREYQRVTRSNPKARVSRNAYERRRRHDKKG